jgi:hypothetical protein
LKAVREFRIVKKPIPHGINRTPPTPDPTPPRQHLTTHPSSQICDLHHHQYNSDLSQPPQTFTDLSQPPPKRTRTDPEQNEYGPKKRLSSSLPHILQDHHRSAKISNHHRSTKTSGHHLHSNEKTHHQHQDHIKTSGSAPHTTPAGKTTTFHQEQRNPTKIRTKQSPDPNQYISPTRRGNSRRRSRSLAVKMMKE